MSHFNLATQLNLALKFDGGPDGPVPRWQRKARDKGLTIATSSGDNSLAVLTPHNRTPHSASSLLLPTETASLILNNSKSPGRGRGNNSLLSTTACNRSLNCSIPRSKSPGRTLKLAVRAKTPTRLTPNTPLLGGNIGDTGYAGDRFIPLRPTEQEHERSHHLVMQKIRKEEGVDGDEGELSQQELDHRAKLADNLNDGQPLDQKIVHFSKRAAPTNISAPDMAANNQKVLFSATKSSTSKGSSTRHIPNVPERVLDAPELIDDYYLHLVDWSCHNHVVVALGTTVYVWNAADGSIVSLATVEPPEYICSLAWIKDGSVLAVGISEGYVQLWDPHQKKLMRTMPGHRSRVPTLAWNDSTLSTGSRTGQIIHHDVRIANHVIGVLNAHNEEVCGLSWSSNSQMLASGGNDNVVNIWDARATTPLHTMRDHQAAVKAVAWCPWQHNILSTGGGTADRTIRLWNVNTGSCIKEVTTNSQVSSIVWSDAYKELITGHGYLHNQLTIWKYPNFTKVAELTGHTGRVLEMVASPDGEMVASAAADETIRLWKCWPTIRKDKKVGRTLQPTSSLTRSIR